METNSGTEENRQKNIHRQRLARLAADKQQIFGMSPESALDAILEHPLNQALVHSMAEEDFFFLINEIGHQDAIDLLFLASNRQWEYILDIEAWHRDRIQLDSVVYWLNLLHRADPGRFIQWSINEKYDLLEYFLNRRAEIIVREPDEYPGDLADGFFTCDDVFYIRFTSGVYAGAEDEEDREEMEDFVYTLIRRIADEDHGTYQMLLLRAASVIPGECEEEAYRFRNVRLAEKGFLPFEEAVGVYAPVKPEAIRKKAPKKIATNAGEDFTLPVPVHPVFMLKDDSLFGRALQTLDAPEVLEETQIEFASLCNRIIAADQVGVREKEQLRGVVNKACGFLGIGMHRLAETEAPPGPAQGAALISGYSLTDIFRTGHAMILELKNRGEQWRKQSWFSKNRLALSFWGEHLVGHIGGLLLDHPKHFDNYKTGHLYREFASMDDIRQARNALNEAMVFDRLLSYTNIDAGGFPDRHPITVHNVLLTLWARNRVGLDGPERLEPIPLEAFGPFYRCLWVNTPEGARIRDSAKTDFLDWLSALTGLERDAISEKASGTLENLFRMIEDELARVDEKDLDPRYVHLFLLRP